MGVGKRWPLLWLCHPTHRMAQMAAEARDGSERGVQGFSGHEVPWSSVWAYMHKLALERLDGRGGSERRLIKEVQEQKATRGGDLGLGAVVSSVFITRRLVSGTTCGFLPNVRREIFLLRRVDSYGTWGCHGSESAAGDPHLWETGLSRTHKASFAAFAHVLNRVS